MRRAVLEVLWSTGCTLEELIALGLEHVGDKAQRLHLIAGWRQRTVYPSAQAAEALQDYLQVRGEVATQALFCTADGDPLSREQAQDMLREIAAEQGVEKERFFPDLFRGVFIHLARETMGNEREVSELVGEDLRAAEKVEGTT